MNKIIDGKNIAEQIKKEVAIENCDLTLKGERPASLAVLLVGENPASSSYVKSKEKACKELNFNSIVRKENERISQTEILKIIDKWNNDENIDGILVQLPLPKHIDENTIILSINPKKDVDGFHPENIGRLVIGLPGIISCTPAGILELIKRSSIKTLGKHIVVLGRSNIVGKPIANLLYQKYNNTNGIVTICHSQAEETSYYTKQADILILAIGVPNFIKSKDIKAGAVIIDVGINRIEDNSEKGYKLVGDCDFDEVYDKCSAITPVPGGVGAMTIAMLMSNTMKIRKSSYL